MADDPSSKFTLGYESDLDIGSFRNLVGDKPQYTVGITQYHDLPSMFRSGRLALSVSARGGNDSLSAISPDDVEYGAEFAVSLEGFQVTERLKIGLSTTYFSDIIEDTDAWKLGVEGEFTLTPQSCDEAICVKLKMDTEWLSEGELDDITAGLQFGRSGDFIQPTLYLGAFANPGDLDDNGLRFSTGVRTGSEFWRFLGNSSTGQYWRDHVSLNARYTRDTDSNGSEDKFVLSLSVTN